MPFLILACSILFVWLNLYHMPMQLGYWDIDFKMDLKVYIFIYQRQRSCTKSRKFGKELLHSDWFNFKPHDTVMSLVCIQAVLCWGEVHTTLVWTMSPHHCTILLWLVSHKLYLVTSLWPVLQCSRPVSWQHQKIFEFLIQWSCDDHDQCYPLTWTPLTPLTPCSLLSLLSALWNLMPSLPESDPI